MVFRLFTELRSMFISPLECLFFKSPYVDSLFLTSYGRIYCIECACTLQLTEPRPSGHRIPPAFNTSLSKPGNTVVAVLNTNDNYQIIVLSGHSPSIIIDICTCGLVFWTYQVVLALVRHSLPIYCPV